MAKCGLWAAEKQCKENHVLMLAHCRKSCGLCKGNQSNIAFYCNRLFHCIYCTVLHRIVVYCDCSLLYCIVLYCIVLHCIVLYGMV